MPRRLHDPAVRDTIRSRVEKLRPESRAAWGKMSVDQMLWHCNETMEAALSRRTIKVMRPPLPKPVLTFLVLNLPWIKGAPTHPDWVARAQYDFDAERARTLRLIDEFTGKPLDSPGWGMSGLGALPAEKLSQLHAKHLDHHLKQFGA